MLRPLAAWLTLLAASVAPAANAPEIVVPFNCDDDNADGVLDFEGPQFDTDDDAVVVWSEERGGPAPTEVACGAPDFVRVTRSRAAVRIDALRPIGPDWNGRFTVTLRFADAAARAVPCRVAPLLVRSSLDPVRTVFVREFPGRNDKLLQQLAEVCESAAVTLHVVPTGDPYADNHIWLQDTVEFLEASGASAPMTIALAGVRNRTLDAFARERLLGPGVGFLRVGRYREAFAKGEGGASWIDWYGNLEASPPTAAYPKGRVLYGVDRPGDAQLHPDVVAFLAAQNRQPPLALDVGWLLIKHVDEMVGFAPARDGGILVLVPDPTQALETLRAARADGHGETPMLEAFDEGVTVASLLDDGAFVDANERLWRERIEPMAVSLLEGIGLPRERLRRLPVLFHPNGAPRTPNVVNALVLPGMEGRPGWLVAADPHGPLVKGRDVLRAATRCALADAAVRVAFVDDRQYHLWSGNVHCATNAVRPLGAAGE